MGPGEIGQVALIPTMDGRGRYGTARAGSGGGRGRELEPHRAGTGERERDGAGRTGSPTPGRPGKEPLDSLPLDEDRWNLESFN